MEAFLISGTDTGVGKTYFCESLAKLLKGKGVKVGYFKPIETGVKEIPEDGSRVCRITGQELKEAILYTFKSPLAPYTASLEEGVHIDLALIRDRFFQLKEKYEVLLVEGAGGIAVPITHSYDYMALAKDLGLPVIVVARAGLGTINHTFLTWYYLKQNGVKVKLIVLNRYKGLDLSEKTNPFVITQLTKTYTYKLYEGRDLDESILPILNLKV